jgi:Uma2 family endonuclease
MHNMQERIDEYLAFGIPTVWVIDPETRRGFFYTSEGMREAKDGILRSRDTSLQVPLRALFED